MISPSNIFHVLLHIRVLMSKGLNNNFIYTSEMYKSWLFCKGSQLYSYILLRRGSRIQKGGFVHSEGGGGSYRNFRSGSKLLQGPEQINKQKKIADSRRGGGVRTPQKKPPVSAHATIKTFSECPTTVFFSFSEGPIKHIRLGCSE